MSLTRKRQLVDAQSIPKRQVHKYEPIAKLFSVKPDQPHLLIPKIPRGIVVGRSSTCDIKIAGSDVSSKHCQFTLTNTSGKEYLLLTDTSTNGTSVNGELLGKGITRDGSLRGGERGA
ncbi:hypothetical protein OXX79_004327 [Metschnikowia pulcherrima]